MDTLNIISVIIGIAGLGGTIFFGVKSLKLRRQIRRFSWSDIESGVDTLIKKTYSSFKPEIIISVSPPGKVVAGLFVLRNSEVLPHYSCFSTRACEASNTNNQNSVMNFKTSKWCYEIPDEILKFKENNILIIEDAVVTGDSLENFLSFLIKSGFKRDKIMTGTIIATESAIAARKGPDFFCFNVPDANIYMPWGKLGGAYY